MNQNREAAVELYGRGQYGEAAQLIAAALADRETSDLWSDWAAVQLALGRQENVEKAFRRAIALDPSNTVAALNLGVFLASQHRFLDAIPWLERGAAELAGTDRQQAAAVLESCRQQAASSAPTQVSAAEGDGSEDTAATRMRILVVHEVLPHTDRSGSDVRLMQVLRELRAQGHEVAYLARNGADHDKYAPALENLGIRIWAHDAERLRYQGIDSPADWTLERVLEENKFHLAILFHWFWAGPSVSEHYMQEIRRLSPATRIAVLSDDQHGLRELRMANFSGLWSDYERAQDFTNREMEVYRRADVVQAISEDDRRGLLALDPGLNIEVMPMIAEVPPPGPGFGARAGFLFLGNFDNLANRDGVAWMLANVWPLVRAKLPAAEVALVGNNLPAQLGVGHHGVRRVGHVADLEPLFAEYRVFVAPVRFGTGIKTKNLAALTHGLPVVTTACGAEGLNLSDGRHALLAETSEAFAEAMVRAYSDEQLWQTLARESQRHIAIELGPQRLQEAVRGLIRQARELPPKPYDPAFVWSYLLVEKRHPEVLGYKPAYHRPALRLAGYVELAEEFLAGHRPARALAQLRHLLSLVRGAVPSNPLFQRVLALMGRCYRALGEMGKASDYEQLLAKMTSEADSQHPVSWRDQTNSRKARRQKSRPDFSVIIPTYNRRETLGLCLAGLAAQSLPPDRFEVIVIDDGSTDGTEEFCRAYPRFFPFGYIRQQNAGAGAARRAGVAKATGELVLLINDDTIATPSLLAEHLRAQDEHRREKVAVLGNFPYPGEARERALTHFLSTHPFLFPQCTLDPGLHSKNAYFIACNLSLRRDVVLGAGSFDPRFRVAEDTELGVRLRATGYQVLYHPQALAIHDHLGMTSADLVRRAETYGRTQLLLFRKHPRLLGNGTGPFGRLDEAAIARILNSLRQQREAVQAGLQALEKLDQFDLTPHLQALNGERSRADQIMDTVARVIPVVFWYFLYKGFLAAWNEQNKELKHHAHSGPFDDRPRRGSYPGSVPGERATVGG